MNKLLTSICIEENYYFSIAKVVTKSSLDYSNFSVVLIDKSRYIKEVEQPKVQIDKDETKQTKANKKQKITLLKVDLERMITRIKR